MENSFEWYNRATLPREEKVLVCYRDPRNGYPNFAIGHKTVANRDFPYEIFSLDGGGAMRLELIFCWTKLVYPDFLKDQLEEAKD